MDYTGVNVLEDLKIWLEERHIELYFTGCSVKTERKISREFHVEAIFFYDIDDALQFSENNLLKNASKVRKKWQKYEPLRAKHHFEVLKMKHDVFEHLFSDMRAARDIWKYIEEVKVKKNFLAPLSLLEK